MMEMEMTEPDAPQDVTPRETRIPQPAEVTETSKVPQILATVAGKQFPTSRLNYELQW
jgi:hypothetical protein